MSELTPCNFCSLNRIKERAKENGMIVTLIPCESGTDVYVHPKSITRPDLDRSKYFRAWMMEIPDHCCC